MASSWYFSREELAHGLTQEELKTEITQRRATCAFLQEAGMKLRLPQLTIATAVIFFHRFYARYRFKDYDRYTIGTTCLFLAGKVEETPKKLKDVIEVTYMLRFKGKDIPKQESPEFIQLKDQILTHELIVLQTIAFDLTVEHPYKYLLSYVKGIQGNRSLAQVAWNFVNDSLRTTLCLQHKPQYIASAAIFLASKFLKYQLPEGKKPWWEVFEARLEDLEAISIQILDLYDSTPNVESIKINQTTFTSDNESKAPLSQQSPTNNNNNNIPPPPPPSVPPPPPPHDTKESPNGSNNSSRSPPPVPPPPRSPPNSNHRGSSEGSRDNKDRERDRGERDRERDDRDRDSRRSSGGRRSRSRSPRSRSRSRSRSPRSGGSRRESRSGPVRHERDSRSSKGRSSSSGTSNNSSGSSSSRSSSSSSSSSRNSSSSSSSSTSNSSRRREDELNSSKEGSNSSNTGGSRYHPYE